MGKRACYKVGPMSETPKKKPAKKAQSKKAQPKAPTSSAQPAKRGRPPKKVQQKMDAAPKESFSDVEEFLDGLERIVASDASDRDSDSVVVRTNDVKSASLRKRMLKWFKK